MRESRAFAERTRVFSSDKTLKKYFLVYEGSDTEAIYFNAINAKRDEVGINPLIELISIKRSYSETGWSNPEKILNRIIENLEESKTNCISYENLLNRIMDYLIETKIITADGEQTKDIWETICRICMEKFQTKLNFDVEDVEKTCQVILKTLQEEYELKYMISDISNIIKGGELTYAEDFDKICLIVDRDRKSFISESERNQYDYVVDKCEEKGFGLYVTNPCFEFWLLLHFNEVFELDRDKLLMNPKVTAKRSYVERELCRIWPGYKKSSYKAEALMPVIDLAVRNEKEFCEDLQQLKMSVGSNIGLLIEELRR